MAATPTPPSSLDLDHHVLTALTRIYGLELPAQGLVLFGLRGLSPEQPAEGKTWVEQSRLQALGVDYRHLRCTLGLWDRAGQRLFTALASTVPHTDQVDLAAAKKGAMKGRGTNQLEPGFYTDLTKGEHLQGKARGHQALRQTGFRFYRRSHHAAPYKASDPLYFGNPYDNLHCAWNLDGQEPGYSSAGCMVVAGMPHCPRQPGSGPNQGAWQVFHDLVYAAPQNRFPIVLLSGAEALKAALEWQLSGPAKTKPRLVFGSRGDAVTALQNQLIRAGKMKGKATGYLGTTTYRAWNAAGLKGYGDLLGC